MNRIISAISKIEIKPLDLGERMGHTGYIDFLGPDDLSHDIMTGKDKHGRQFLSLKLTVEFIKKKKKLKKNYDETEVDVDDETDAEVEGVKVKSQAVVTLFNRYVDNDLVAHGTNWHPPTLFTGNIVTDAERDVVIDRLDALQNGHIIRDIVYTKCFYTNEEMKQFYLENTYGNGDMDLYIPSARSRLKNTVKKLFYTTTTIHDNLLPLIAEFL